MARHNTIFFISIDIILDTRLTILNEIDPDATLEILKNKKYFEREIDDWELLTDGKIKNEDFKLRYDKRNKETLKKSKLTKFPFYLKDFIKDAEDILSVDNTAGQPKIYLNTYPYLDLDDIEKEAFREAVEILCGCIITEVVLCCYNPHQLLPVKIKNEYEYMFLYNYEEWKNIHIDSIGRKDMMGVYVTVPKLFIEKVIPDEFLEIDEGLRITPWKAAEMCMLPFMNLNMIEADIFSLALS